MILLIVASMYKPKNRKSPIIPIAIVVFLLGSIGAVYIKSQVFDSTADNNQPSSIVGLSDRKKADSPIKTFSGEEFKQLYQNISYPNTGSFTAPPAITGNEVADSRIREIAEARGFLLTSQPTRAIVRSVEPNTTENEDDLLQPSAYSSWISIKSAAAKDGIPLKMLSGYRSPQIQKDLFLNRLNINGATPDAIAAGLVDDIVAMTLTMTAPPGYSRHHTGYTIDFSCGNDESLFETSPCFSWLSNDNYANAKAAGWIPSYPIGADKQGPEPESWEYVWVGDNLLR